MLLNWYYLNHMAIQKQLKDYLLKWLWGSDSVPQGLVELTKYFINYGPIQFDYQKVSDGWVAISKNFQYGSIVTSGKDEKQLDDNIKDAILTSFEVPSSYLKEAGIYKVGKEREYAVA